MLCFCCCMPAIPQLIIVHRLIRMLIPYDKQCNYKTSNSNDKTGDIE